MWHEAVPQILEDPQVLVATTITSSRHGGLTLRICTSLSKPSVKRIWKSYGREETKQAAFYREVLWNWDTWSRSLLGYNVVRFVTKVETFRGILLPPSSGSMRAKEEWATQISNSGLLESCDFFACSVKCLIYCFSVGLLHLKSNSISTKR